MAIPQTVFTGTDAVVSQYDNAIVSSFDIHKPLNLNKLFDKYGSAGQPFFNVLKSLGNERRVAQSSYSRFNKDWAHETIKFGAVTAQPAIGATGVYTLDADSLDANNRFYPRIYDTVYFQSGVTGTIIGIGGAGTATVTLSIAPNVATQQLPAAAADDEVAIVSDAFAEGSGQPRGTVTKVDKYTNFTQIIKETKEVTGSEMTNQSWVTIKGVEGNPLYTDSMADAEYQMALKISGALLFQERTTNPNITDPTAEGRRIQTTEGLIPYMRRFSPRLTVAAGALTIAEFDTIDRIMDRAFSGNYVLTMLGIARHQETENVLHEYFQDTNVNYNRKVMNEVLFNGDESLAATVNWKLFTKSERTYLMKRLNMLSHPKMGGVDGQITNKTVDLGLLVPINRSKDSQSGGLMDSIGCVYKGFGQYNRMMEVFSTGSAGPGPVTSDVDVRNYHWRCEVGGDWGQAEQMLLIES